MLVRIVSSAVVCFSKTWKGTDHYWASLGRALRLPQNLLHAPHFDGPGLITSSQSYHLSAILQNASHASCAGRCPAIPAKLDPTRTRSWLHVTVSSQCITVHKRRTVHMKGQRACPQPPDASLGAKPTHEKLDPSPQPCAQVSVARRQAASEALPHGPARNTIRTQTASAHARSNGT